MTNQINNQSIIPSTDVIQVTLTLKMTTPQVDETPVTVNKNSPIQDYVHPDEQTQPTFEMTRGFKPFTIIIIMMMMMIKVMVMVMMNNFSIEFSAGISLKAIAAVVLG